MMQDDSGVARALWRNRRQDLVPRVRRVAGKDLSSGGWVRAGCRGRSKRVGYLLHAEA
jgi:hypothetical protein